MIEKKSTVICVTPEWDLTPAERSCFNRLPNLHCTYTVRGFYVFNGCLGIYLEEIVSPLLPILGFEPAFNIRCFRELDLDQWDISELLENTLVCVAK